MRWGHVKTDLRSVSDGRELSQRGAERGQLLRHPLHGGRPVRGVGGAHVGRDVQGEHLALLKNHHRVEVGERLLSLPGTGERPEAECQPVIHLRPLQNAATVQRLGQPRQTPGEF